MIYLQSKLSVTSSLLVDGLPNCTPTFRNNKPQAILQELFYLKKNKKKNVKGCRATEGYIRTQFTLEPSKSQGVVNTTQRATVSDSGLVVRFLLLQGELDSCFGTPAPITFLSSS